MKNGLLHYQGLPCSLNHERTTNLPKHIQMVGRAQRTSYDDTVVNALINKYGQKPQAIKFIEEASELMKNLAKMLLSSEPPFETENDLPELIRCEIVDVMITLHSLRIIYGKNKTEIMYRNKLHELIAEHDLKI